MSDSRRPAGHDAPGSFEDSDDSLSWTKVQHLLHAPLRRPLMVLVPWGAIVALSVAALLVLPKRYVSSTLILIESEKVPDSFVPRVAMQSRGRSLDTIRPEILSRTRLERVIGETRPFPEIASTTAAVDAMRRSTSVNSSGVDGFTIEFVHADPRKAREVTDRLASLFIEETIKARQEQVEGAVDFLVTQVDDARKELEKKDETMRRYKELRMGRLPEQLQTNLATMGMLQQELRSVEETLLFARERQEALLREPRVSRDARGAPAVDDIANLREQLANLKARYTDDHPDVQSMGTRIARLESRMAAASSANPEAVSETPGAVRRDQLDRTKAEVKKLEERRGDLESRISSLRVRIEDTPRTEQELANLNRDYQKLNENYTSLLAKQLEAQMAGRLENRWKGDRFRMLDPASLPEKPSFPKPLLIIGMGIAVGLCVGLGTAVAAELLDPTVKDPEDLESLLDYPVLGRIPHLPDLTQSAGR